LAEAHDQHKEEEYRGATGKYQVLPPLSNDEYQALKEDIAENGILVPIEVDEHGEIIDGYHRAKICEDLGIPYPMIVRAGLSEQQKREHAWKLNLCRRQLNQKQRREMVVQLLKEIPEKSNRVIANIAGVDHKTVSAVRKEITASGEIPHIETFVGADGRKFKAKSVIVSNRKEAKEAGKILRSLPEESILEGILNIYHLRRSQKTYKKNHRTPAELNIDTLNQQIKKLTTQLKKADSSRGSEDIPEDFLANLRKLTEVASRILETSGAKVVSVSEESSRTDKGFQEPLSPEGPESEDFVEELLQIRNILGS